MISRPIKIHRGVLFSYASDKTFINRVQKTTNYNTGQQNLCLLKILLKFLHSIYFGMRIPKTTSVFFLSRKVFSQSASTCYKLMYLAENNNCK